MKNRTALIGGGAALVVVLVLAYAFIGSPESAHRSSASLSAGDPANAFESAKGSAAPVRDYTGRGPSSERSRLEDSESDTEGDAAASGDPQAKAKKKKMSKRRRGQKARQNDLEEGEQRNPRKKVPLKTARGIPAGG